MADFRPDWATEITYKMAKGIAKTGREAEMFFDALEVAAAIRQVKIDTLRQAASMTRADCYVLADKIERGEQ